MKDYLITGIFPLTLVILTAGLISGCLFSDRFKGSLKQQYQVEIIRDTWGVPHIFGQTDADTAYGLAYANAEDDFETIQMVFPASACALDTWREASEPLRPERTGATSRPRSCHAFRHHFLSAPVPGARRPVLSSAPTGLHPSPSS